MTPPPSMGDLPRPAAEAAAPAPLAASFQAQAVAMSARTNQLTRHAVDDLRSVAEETLPKGHELRAAILTFATGYEVLRHDPYGLAKLGEQLEAALHRALGVIRPELRPRSDIDG